MYSAEITDEAERDFEQLDKQVAARIRKRIKWLAEKSIEKSDYHLQPKRIARIHTPPIPLVKSKILESQRIFAGSLFYSGALARAGTGIEAGVALVLAARTGVPQ